MTTRPKDIGTRAESAIVRAARTRGFPGADRRTQTGRYDRGDILLCPGIIIEAKGGDMAKRASDTLIDDWLDETQTERMNAGAEVAFLVTQRAGHGPQNAHNWWAHWRLGWLMGLDDLFAPPAGLDIHTPIRLTLGNTLLILRAWGWGTPLGMADGGIIKGTKNGPPLVRQHHKAEGLTPSKEGLV